MKNRLVSLKLAVKKEKDESHIRQDELDLINGCLKNDRQAQKKLYYKYCKAMFTVAYRIINNYDVANDILQDAFIQIFKDIKSFRKESTLGAWIKTIVVRTALKELREKDFFVSIENTDEFNQNVEMPVVVDNSMSGSDLEKAILSLPDGYRTVFLLIEVEGYSHKEVANMLNISEGTSKSQLFYAKKQLQQKLGDFIN